MYFSFMKGRESGMPDLSYWQTFFDEQSIIRSLIRLDNPSKILEFGSGYGTFTIPLVQAGHLDLLPTNVKHGHCKLVFGKWKKFHLETRHRIIMGLFFTNFENKE
jgi:predicted O-methyltransferase YrrM